MQKEDSNPQCNRKRIKHYHRRSRGTYGAQRIQVDLREEDGLSVGQKRISRLMAEANIHGVTRRRKVKTTIRDSEARPAPDLVNRNFRAEAPNRLWVADITYVPTQVGFLYLAVVLDVFSRRIVGWHMGNNLRTDLVLNALQMAINQRQPEGVVHHSDQGTQYTSLAFGQRCREAGIRPSMGSVGDCYDNAMCEAAARPAKAGNSINAGAIYHAALDSEGSREEVSRSGNCSLSRVG
ncbi:MAG: IS3 family transposase [Acidobacteriota bacterium]|nr:MAG: IS3 family transposase [Acidobacteriota bacterium]